jgi:RNA polymerase-binding transcription factor DksA
MRLDSDTGTSSDTTTERPGRARNRANPSQKPSSANGRGRAVTNGARLPAPRGPLDANGGARDRTLTGAQIERLEQRLLEEWKRAVRTLWAKRVDIEDHREVGDLDKVELDIRMVERHSEFITLIDEALQRLRQSPGDFDVSVVSGARIPFERLEMVPWTRRLTEEVGHD